MDKRENGGESVFAIYRGWSTKPIGHQEEMETKSRGLCRFTTKMGSEWRKRKVYPTNLGRKKDECRSTKEESGRDCMEMGDVMNVMNGSDGIESLEEVGEVV